MKTKKKSAVATAPAGVASELIIATQSAFLFLFGVAAIMSTSAVVNGFNALRSATSSAAIITDEGIVTDEGVFKLEHIRGIIDNFQLIGISITIFGAIVCGACALRLWRKARMEAGARGKVFRTKR